MSEQSKMFLAGEELPLFSGTPVVAREPQSSQKQQSFFQYPVRFGTQSRGGTRPMNAEAPLRLTAGGGGLPARALVVGSTFV